MELLRSEIRAVISKRDGRRYHSPKNLAMALSVEASELLEIFQWLSPAESRRISAKEREHIEEEIGDIMIYLTILADVFNLDPVTAAKKKLEKNRLKDLEPG